MIYDRICRPDSIVCLGSYDFRVAEYGAELANEFVDLPLIITGKLGNWTRDTFGESEARAFSRVVFAKGIDPARVILEEKATNLGENVRFVKDLLHERSAKSLLFLTKPQTQRRLKLTLQKQWPEVVSMVSAPRISFVDYETGEAGIDRLLNEMVGDVDRIIKYPAMGFQEAEIVPEEVMLAYRELKDRGFDKHCIA